ncbi:MAG: CAP domain-containing protein [Aggregatilineales bacterium]
MRKLLYFCLLMLVMVPFSLSAQTDTAWSMLALLNTERASLNMRPLALNPALISAAQRHSDDMARGEFLSHTGSDESEFWERIADAGYNMISGAENVLYRNDADALATFNQLLNSPEYYSNMVNPVYQEMGIAFARSSSGRVYFTMLLASRADFTPPTATPSVIVPSATLPIVPTTPIAQSTTPPQSSPTPNPTTTSIPPTTMPGSPTPQPTVTEQARIDAAILQQGIASVLVGQVRVGQVNPTAIPSPTPILTATPLPTFDISLEYSSDSFTLINASTVPLYIEGLYFESETGAMDVGRWNTQFLTASLSGFPAQGCLQVWNLETTTPLDAPANCDTRHAWIAVNDGATFWRGGTTFDVYRFGELITTCTVSVGVCEFNLEDRTALASQPENDAPNSNPVTVGSSDLLLIYDTVSFSLVNTSGADLDLTGLGFASASGVVNISEWDTQFLSRSLNAFPPNDCLQAWSIFDEEWSVRPSECNVRHAWIAVNEAQMFWTNTDAFTVSRGGAVLATCAVNQGRCEVDLP